MRGGAPHSASSVLAAIGFPVENTCRCGTAVQRPGNCRPCDDIEAAERRAEEMAQRVKLRVPAVYRWASLDSPDLQAAIGNGHVVIPEVCAWLSDPDAAPILLLRGDTHVLKSTVAGACVAWETMAGRDAYFVLAVDLAPLPERPTDKQRETRSDALHRVSNYRALVAIDDMAKILGGAPGDSGQAHWRRGDFCAALHRRWQARAKTILPTTLENRGTGKAPGILELFGEDILARVTDERSAKMVRLERKR